MKNTAKTLLFVGVLALASFGMVSSALARFEISEGPDCPGSGQDCAYDENFTYVKSLGLLE